MSGHTFLRTIKKEVIQQWIESRGGRPGRISYATDELRVVIGTDEPWLEPMAWEAWWDAFNEKELAFMYEPKGFGYKVLKRNGKEDGGPPPEAEAT